MMQAWATIVDKKVETNTPLQAHQFWGVINQPPIQAVPSWPHGREIQVVLLHLLLVLLGGSDYQP
jgi:hypothetical protein